MFFADSRLWLGGNGKWKAEKGYLGDNQERFIQIERLLACGIRLFFQLMKSRLIKKDLFSVYYGNAFLPCQTNVQLPFSNTACHCELAESPLFFETSQSCVCTAAPLSHRFKSSPAIPGKPAILGTAGYMMNAGHFHRNLVSSGDLNRGRRTESSPPTWSPCSRPFAILPVSAVSDAQKLATGNFLCVRA